jgi:hypothetical protein
MEACRGARLVGAKDPGPRTSGGVTAREICASLRRGKRSGDLEGIPQSVLETLDNGHGMDEPEHGEDDEVQTSEDFGQALIPQRGLPSGRGLVPVA